MKFFSESVFSLCVAALAVFAACDDDRPSDKAGQRVPLQLNVSKPDGTRLDGTQWEEGDQIGVFLQAYDASLGNGSPYVEGVVNVPFDVNPSDGSCTPVGAESAIFLEKGQTYAVLAYYPYTEDLTLDTDGNAAVYAIDSWTKQSNQSKLDLLIARTYGVTADESSVSLTLERAASRLQLNISPSSGMSADAMYNVSAWVSGLNHYTDWDMRGRFISHQDLVSDSIPFKMTLDDGKVTGVAIVPPSDGTSITGISISIALSQTDVRTIAIDDETRFEAGKSYSWNISLSPELDIDAIVSQITSMTESGTVVVSGYAHDPDAAIERIKEALGTLATNSPDVFVTLDMSGVIGMTSVGDNAFEDCSALAGITIPGGVTSIGNNAFSNCSNIASITIPSSVTSIGNWAFYGCSGVTSFEIPSSVTSIGDGAFNGCTGLTSITIPSGVTSIGQSAFMSCSGLTSIEIPISVTSIGERAFFGCSGLTSITIPSSVTSIGEGAFRYCTKLTSIEIPSSVTSIGNYAFSGCYGLTSVTIPGGVTSIGNSAFASCYGLTSITIPSGVTSIGSYVFGSCYGLTSIEIPSSVTSIGSKAFDDCSNLTTVYYTGTEADRDNMTIDDGTITGSGVTWVYTNGYGFVDLGLPSGLLWATCNVGASKPEEYGNYYAWGETKAYGEEDTSNAMNYSYNSSSSYVKTYYDWSTYKYCNGSSSTMTKYCPDGDYGTYDNIWTLELADDAANANWGGDWRMPTSADCQELVDNCSNEWVTDYNGTGVAGRLFTSNNNGNTLFLPAAGYRMGASLSSAGSGGRYWSSSLFESNPSSARCLYFDSGDVGTNIGNRYVGFSVRAVLAP